MGSVTSVRVKWNLFFPFWRVFRKVHSMEKIHRWRDHLWFPCLYTALILGAAPSRYFWSSNCMEVTHLKDGEKGGTTLIIFFPLQIAWYRIRENIYRWWINRLTVSFGSHSHRKWRILSFFPSCEFQWNSCLLSAKFNMVLNFISASNSFKKCLNQMLSR